MRDLWTCACTTHFLRERLPRSTVVRAVPNTLQLAMSYIQVHADDLEVNLLSIDPEEPHTVSFHRNWKYLRCTICGSLLGQAEMPSIEAAKDHVGHVHHEAIEGRKTQSETKTPSASSSLELPPTEQHSEVELFDQVNSILFRNVKLDKHRLTADSDIFHLHRLETKVSADILAIISITGCFKMVLRDFRTREPKLLLTILGWDSLVFSSLAPVQPSRSDYTTLMPAIRLIYSHISESPVDPLAPSELLEMDAFSLFELSTLLEFRNSALPKPIALLGTQTISYLHYIPPEN